MALAKTCWKCHRENWAGRQEITPPENTMRSSGLWHRRTWCLFCDAAQDEIAPRGLVPITSRDEPINVRGSNPFIGGNETT